MNPNDHYVVVSSDCHAGASMDGYREYLTSALRGEFDAWRSSYLSEWADLRDTESLQYRRNFDSGLRQAELEAAGIVAEVLYPNTVPPFAPKPGLSGPDPDVTSVQELELRWAGIHAHNQWLADFCSELPGRRGGVAQILLNDVERAVEEIRWVATKPHFVGVLIPNPSPDRAVAQLHAPSYEPIWTECEALGLPVHTHGGGGVPDYGDHPSSRLMMYLEFGWYAFRPLVRLTMSGVFERHPALRFVMTELSWMPEILSQLDYMALQIRTATSASVESSWGSSMSTLSLLPSEYWQRQGSFGASILNPSALRELDPPSRRWTMWGADYPHTEGTHPHTRAALRHVFAGVPTEDVADMLGLNAIRAFGFDLDVLRPVADRIGPTVAEVDTPLSDDERPVDATSMAFARVSPQA